MNENIVYGWSIIREALPILLIFAVIYFLSQKSQKRKESEIENVASLLNLTVEKSKTGMKIQGQYHDRHIICKDDFRSKNAEQFQVIPKRLIVKSKMGWIFETMPTKNTVLRRGIITYLNNFNNSVFGNKRSSGERIIAIFDELTAACEIVETMSKCYRGTWTGYADLGASGSIDLEKIDAQERAEKMKWVKIIIFLMVMTWIISKLFSPYLFK